MRKLIDIFFLLFITSLTMSCLPYAIMAITNQQIAFYRIAFLTLQIPKYFDYIRFSKDIIICILLLLYAFDVFFMGTRFKKKFIMPILLVVLILIPFGTFSLHLSNKYSLLLVVAGMRSLAYFIGVYIYMCQYLKDSNLYSIKKVIDVSFYINTIICILQISLIIQKLGINALPRIRIFGTFPDFASLSTFTVSYIMFTSFYKYYLLPKKSIILKILTSCIIVVATGSRASLLAMMILIAAHIYICLFKNKRRISTLLLFLSIPMGISLLKIVELITQRGSILTTQLESGRVAGLVEYLKTCGVKELLMGVGIGYGTNSAVMLTSVEDSPIMDGTISTLLTQYGIPMMLIIIAMGFMGISKSFKQHDILKYTYLLISVLFVITLNLFEEYAFFTIFTLTCFLFSNRNTPPFYILKLRQNETIANK